MDVIAMIVGLVAGYKLRSFWMAATLAVATELAVTGWQYLFTDPRVWGDEMPADLFGLMFLSVVSVGFAALGAFLRRRSAARRVSTST